MTTPSQLPPVPTPEQLSALEQFFRSRERESAPGLAAGGEVLNLVGSWGAGVYRNGARVKRRLEAGDLDGAARAWQVLLDLAWWWRNDPRLPEEIREQVVVAGNS